VVAAASAVRMMSGLNAKPGRLWRGNRHGRLCFGHRFALYAHIRASLSGTLRRARPRFTAVLRVLAVVRFLHLVFVIGYHLAIHLTLF
jgi:hypothetical protein